MSLKKDSEDVILKFERPNEMGEGAPVTWVMTGGEEWNSTFLPSQVVSLEIREYTGKGRTESRSRHINRVDELSNRVCVIVAYWAKNSGALTGEPFFTMHRVSPITNKATVCHINNTHVNL